MFTNQNGNTDSWESESLYLTHHGHSLSHHAKRKLSLWQDTASMVLHSLTSLSLAPSERLSHWSVSLYYYDLFCSSAHTRVEYVSSESYMFRVEYVQYLPQLRIFAAQQSTRASPI
mmetsp:Transcript_8340/g.30811  ORF Transcript_8340/g.30811 Transcript_8340/m.30811 type:complete len:116 (-) Transcript_8340:2342-2689(-)